MGLAQTTAASTLAEGSQVRVRMRMKPVRAATFAGPMARVNTKGSTAASTFHPLNEPISSEGVAVHRVTAEVAANTGCSLTVNWQQTDTPDDVTSWVTGGTLGSAMTTNGMFYPGKPVAVAPTKGHLRYGVTALNIAGTGIEAALARLVVDVRDQ